MSGVENCDDGYVFVRLVLWMGIHVIHLTQQEVPVGPVVLKDLMITAHGGHLWAKVEMLQLPWIFGTCIQKFQNLIMNRL